MADTMEFKKLADVETIEEVTEEDTVLVVQGGEVKQTPKTQVGGANEPDIVFSVVNNNGSDTPTVTAETEIDNVYEFLKTSYENGVIPNIIIQVSDGETGVIFVISRCLEISALDDVVQLFALAFGIECKADNTFSLMLQG